MNPKLFSRGHLLLPLLLFAPWQVMAEDQSETIAPGEVPVTEMMLSEDVETTETTESEIDANIHEQPATPFFSFLDVHQQVVSSYLKGYVLGIDNFFTDSFAIEETSGSYLRITLESYWPEGHGAEFDGGISLRLRLPKTQKKLKLVFTSDIDEQRDALAKETGNPSSTPDGEDKTYFTGIEGAVGGSSNWKIRPSIGLRLRSPLILYLRLRANREEKFEDWILGINETLYWFDDATGFGSDTNMRWDRPLSETVLFRSNSFVRYTDEFDYYEMSQTFSLIHTLSKKRAITYKVGVFGKNEPTTHATAYLLNALYRNNIHKDYLFLDIQPQLLFERENEFKGRTEFFIRLQLYYRG